MNLLARREVLRAIGRVPLWAALSAVVAACGGGSDSSTRYGGSTPTGGGTTPTPACDGIAPTMDLHNHPACLTMAELQAAGRVTLTLQAGTTGHTHTVTLSAAEVQTLRDTANSVTVTSSLTGHTHQVTFT